MYFSMETTTLINRLKSIDFFIRREITGNARELAEKLEITERSVYNYLSLMKSMGAPIVFSISRQSYVYEDDGQFLIGFVSDYESALLKASTQH
jgi:predicted DNA-binding transcriptional regulator YafY